MEMFSSAGTSQRRSKEISASSHGNGNVRKVEFKHVAIHHRPSAHRGMGKKTPSQQSQHDSKLRRRESEDPDKVKEKRIKDQQKLEEISNSYETEQILSQRTHFTVDQIQALFRIHKRLLSGGKMDRLRFRETMYTMLGVTDDIILDRMFNSFDGDSQAAVSQTEWVLGLNAILRGSLDEHIAYSYEIFDINGDRGIGREELHNFLKNCISPIPGHGLHGIDPEEVQECCNDIIELAMKKLDVDGNGVITYADFYDAVQEDPLLLEALGPCLPREKNMKSFLALFADDYGNYSTHYSHPLDIGWDRERDKFNRRKEIEVKVIAAKLSPMLAIKEGKKDSSSRMSLGQRTKTVPPKSDHKLFSGNAFQKNYIG